MRIVHISYNLRGGAGRALYRHHQALRKHRIDSQILVGNEKTLRSSYIHDIKEISPPLNRFQKLRDYLGNKLEPFVGESIFCNQASFAIPDLPIFQKADLIELRMLHSGHGKSFFNLRVLPRISHLKPTIWRLSDMWASTGYCVYTFGCRKWQTGCHHCPQLCEPHRIRSELPQITIDPSKRIWKLKKQLYKRSHLHIVCPSGWLCEQVQKSILMDCTSLTHIPVGVDVGIFYPRDQSIIRKELGISAEKFVLASIIPTPQNYRKALDLLFETLAFVKNKRYLVWLMIGFHKVEIPQLLNDLAIYQVGYVQDDVDLAHYYSAADILCFPSRCDNSAQVLLEAAACGIPSVCFKVCGNPEYVIHRTTGLIIEPYNLQAMAEAIDYLCEHRHLCQELGRAAREHINTAYTTDLQARRFMELYNKLL